MRVRFCGVVASVLAVTVTAHADPLEGKKSSTEVLAESKPEDWRALDPENTLYIELESGRVIIALSPILAQNHVASMKKLAREGFFDGLSFYRVIDGFVAQGGDVLETRSAEKPTLAAEFEEPLSSSSFYELQDLDGYAPRSGFSQSLPTGFDVETKTAWHLHCTGAIAMARQEARDTARTDFYIALQPQRYLDRNLTVFGRVVDGMQHVQALRRVQPAQSPEADRGDKIVAVKVAADVPAEDRTELEILDSNGPSFNAYVEARRNRSDAFFFHRPDHVDVCQLPIPTRPVGGE